MVSLSASALHCGSPASRTLSRTPCAAGTARAWLRGLLRDAGVRDPSVLTDAEIVVSELVTNAVRYGGRDDDATAPCDVGIEVRTGWTVRITVTDRCPRLPDLRRPSETSESGRGMGIVAALSLRWGVECLDGGKAVWAELAAGAGSAPEVGDVDAELPRQDADQGQ